MPKSKKDKEKKKRKQYLSQYSAEIAGAMNAVEVGIATESIDRLQENHHIQE